MSERREATPAAGREAWRLCVAPMMDWTDRHCRWFHRQLAPHARLYTEMVATGAVVFGDADRHLAFSPEERPVAVQFGGCDPDHLARCAELAEARGYDEVNLNCGCPSPRVKAGAFGAVLMLEPEKVAACVAAMRRATSLPVTVKCRIGVDDHDHPDFLCRFVETVARAGCEVFVVHARKAWLEGLSPRENREIPPLDHERVYRLKEAFPELVIVLNGGIRTPEEALSHLAQVDGVMIGREAYANPWVLPAFERALFDPAFRPTRRAVLERVVAYAREMHGREGVPVHAVARHLLGLANGLPGARHFRRILSEETRGREVDPRILLDAWARVRDPEEVALTHA